MTDIVQQLLERSAQLKAGHERGGRKLEMTLEDIAAETIRSLEKAKAELGNSLRLTYIAILGAANLCSTTDEQAVRAAEALDVAAARALETLTSHGIVEPHPTLSKQKVTPDGTAVVEGRTREQPLLPCPFCANEAEIERYGDHSMSTIYGCTFCGARLETNEEWGHGAGWNKRPAVAEARRRALMEAAEMVDARCAEILSKQDEKGQFDPVNTNLRLIACILPDIASSLRSAAEKGK